MNASNRSPLFALVLLCAASFIQCGTCEQLDVQSLGLSGGRHLVAYVEACGATIDNSGGVVQLVDSTVPMQQGQTVFRSFRSDMIGVRRLSRDTVVILYTGDVAISKERAGGLHLVYRQDQEWQDSIARARKARSDQGLPWW